MLVVVLVELELLVVEALLDVNVEEGTISEVDGEVGTTLPLLDVELDVLEVEVEAESTSAALDDIEGDEEVLVPMEEVNNNADRVAL